MKTKLNNDLKEALKSKDKIKVSTIRMLLSAIHNQEIEKRTKSGDSELSDEEVIEVLNREAKKRKESIAVYEKGGRSDLARREESELKIIKQYLPEELSEDEISKIVDKVLKELSGPAAERAGEFVAGDFGKIMGKIMPEVRGRADAGLVKKVLTEKLGA